MGHTSVRTVNTRETAVRALDCVNYQGGSHANTCRCKDLLKTETRGVAWAFGKANTVPAVYMHNNP